MALPPTIPTSFVPKQPVETGARRAHDGNNVFLLAGAVIAAVAILGAGATFGYQKYLESVRSAKASQVAAAEKDINQETVEGFIRLQNRLLAANTLLGEHVALSQFFDLLESITLQNVRFSNLHILVANDRTAHIQMTGIAKNFNALAAESSAFAGESEIRSAIFAQIKVNSNGTVGFTVTADLDPKLLLAKVPDAAVTNASDTPVTAPETTPAVETSASTTGL